MRAAVTRGRGAMEVVGVPEPGAPGPGDVLVAPEAVGLCGSDFHYFTGDIGTIDDPSTLYPRIQGHEAAGTILDVGPDCPAELVTGTRVALWPVGACGTCYACRIGRGNACVRISLIGVHRDGALQERLLVPAAQVFPVGDQDAALAALIEPVSIAVRAVVRGRVAAAERVVVLGAGPIGQALALAATDRGASVLLVDTLASRLARAEGIGADTLEAGGDGDLAAAVREWAGGDGPEVVIEATGVPGLVQQAVEVVAHAGRVVVVGLSADHTPVRVGDLPLKEIDVLGVSCCGAEEFAAAVDLVGRRRNVAASLVTHEFTLARAPEAIAYAMAHPVEVMKAVVRVDAA
ncbi:zinc-binding dehydrogenase [Gaiella sp.]|uniref:zinc-binding dehydrogenase n=1 Tax=Gaiella sp. TaxID=2663207 RepID=UPI002BC2D69F|nr:alcohol dehydrogenase catalytic domain-containing protein [Gaiella sp.]HWO81333.1 alcohol dehydrogenase catalytic domain-containing protein [Gaiella sp.]